MTVWQQPLPPIYQKLTDAELRVRIDLARQALGNKLVILGHHYQQDAVIDFADFTGDSFELSRKAADQRDAEYVVFCGVHFMAESADILTPEHVRVILPDLGAGCSMADMANLDTNPRMLGPTPGGLPRSANRAHHVYEQLSRDQSIRWRARRRGLHQQQLPQCTRMGDLQ